MSRQNILFVDDSKPLVQLFKDHVLKNGSKYGVFTAANGMEAIEILEKETIALVVLDIQMPVMDGLQSLAELHNRKIWLPVIIMTGTDLKMSEKKFGEFGIVDYLKKPVIFEDLDRRINEILMRTENRDSISGISILGILQLLEMEKKTGIMSFKVGNQEGKIFFKEGKVADIQAGGLSNEEVIEEFVKSNMDVKKISIEYIKHLRENKINKSLTEMVLEASKVWDEQNRPR